MKISKIKTHVFFGEHWKRIFKNQRVGSFVSFQIFVEVDKLKQLWINSPPQEHEKYPPFKNWFKAKSD